MPATRPAQKMTDLERELVATLKELFTLSHELMGLPPESVPSDADILKGCRQLREERQARERREAEAAKAQKAWGAKLENG